MLIRSLLVSMLLVTMLSWGAAAQNAGSVVAAASKAMGVDSLNSITYSGTARNGAFGQSKSIGDPMGPVNVTQITAVHAHDQLRPAGATHGARLAGDRSDAAARGAGRAAANAGRVQPEHHRRAGRRQLGPGAEHLDDAVGLPEGRGGQQRHRAPAGRPAGRCRSRRRASSRRRDRRTR